MKSYLKKIFFVLAAFNFYSVVSAQIIYTDINPDTVTASGHSYNLDLNNDGITDFIISDSTWTTSSTNCGILADYDINIIPLTGNGVLSNSTNNPYFFPANTVIEAGSSSWSADGSQSLRTVKYHCGSGHACADYGSTAYCHVPEFTGYGINTTDGRYVGLKLISGNIIYYGWVRLSISITPISSSFTVQEYAFNNTPGVPILTGQKTVFNWVAMDSINPAKNTYCSGDSLKINYTTSGTFNASTIFTAQLSDSNGSFANPIVLGNITGTPSGIISAKVPGKISSGAQYSIRVVCSNTSTDSVYGIKTGIIINGGITSGYYSTSFCSGNVAELTAPAGYIYQWLNNGKIIDGETGNTFAAGISGNYSCIISGLCGTDTSNIIPITVYPLPLAPITASGATTFCKGGNVTLSDTVDKESTYQWGWSYNGGVPALITGATQSSYVADSTGAYTVAVTSKDGCTTQATYISVDAIPPISSANIELDTVGKTNFCAGDSVLMGLTFGYDDPEPIYFQWKKNGANIPGATLEVYYANTAGTYTCTISNRCYNITSNSVTFTTTQCPKPNSATVVIIAPNPFPNSTIISFTLQQQQRTTITIYDMKGRIVRTLADEEFNAGVHTLSWNASDDSGAGVLRGMYFIRIQTEQDVQTKKIIVLR
jgi:hypothetical protein